MYREYVKQITVTLTLEDIQAIEYAGRSLLRERDEYFDPTYDERLNVARFILKIRQLINECIENKKEEKAVEEERDPFLDYDPLNG